MQNGFWLHFPAGCKRKLSYAAGFLLFLRFHAVRYHDIAAVVGRILAGGQRQQLLAVSRADAGVDVAAGKHLVDIGVICVLVHIDVLVVDEGRVIDDVDGERAEHLVLSVAVDGVNSM